jgi:hypothetical protein
MEGAVETSIEALKRRFSAGTDQGLADRLRVGRSTLTSWRRRGALPELYCDYCQRIRLHSPTFWTQKIDPVERQASVPALLRLIRSYVSKITDYRTFLQHGGFLPAQLAVEIEKALFDVTARMTEGEVDDPYKALNLIAYEDFFPEK